MQKLLPGGGGRQGEALEEIAAEIEQAAVHVDGQGEQIPLPAVHGFDDLREEGGGIGGQRGEPAGTGEKGHPTDIHEENVRIGQPGVKGEDQALALPAAVGGAAQDLHRNPRLLA